MSSCISASPIILWTGGTLVIALYLLLNGYGVPKQHIQKIMGLSIGNVVNLTTTQVETLFGELEYIDSQLRALTIG